MQQLPKNTLLQGGKYKIEKVLGQGGFGITYLATQELLERKICIKEFFFKDSCGRTSTGKVALGTVGNMDLVDRFLNKFIKEARTISKLEHPNIIRIFDIFMENGTAYYVMDYIEGESLEDIVKRRGALPEHEAVSYIKQVANALDYLHQHKINHLDVKPANIMVRKADYKAILIDFGVSKQYDEQGEQTSTTPVGISYGYAPIEQYRPGGVSEFSPQADIYSLGATLYKLLTGKIPPQAMEILSDGLPNLIEEFSLQVQNVIRQSMQVRKQDRPNSIGGFIAFFTDNEKRPAKSGIIIKNQQLATDDESAKLANAFFEKAKSMDMEDECDSKDSFPFYLKAANLGHVKAQVRVGKSYLCGIGIEEDKKNAFEWFQKAAESEDVEALSRLAECYNDGIGTKIDKLKAFEIYNKAFTLYLCDAKNGDEIAMANVAYYYENGLGVSKDPKKVFEWTKKMADGTSVEPKLIARLGFFYEMGYGTECDINKSSELYAKVVDLSSAEGLYDIAKHFTFCNNKKEKDQAHKWFVWAAEKGDAEVIKDIASDYEFGVGIEKDIFRALDFYEKAVDQGDTEAMNAIGDIFYFGKEIEKDWCKASQWYKLAVKYGDVSQIQFLAHIYHIGGNGLKIDYKQAIACYQILAEEGNVESMKQIAYLYFIGGYGIEKDEFEAFNWYAKAASNGASDALMKIGSFYKYGSDGVEKNINKAIFWYEKAAEQGDANSMLALGTIYYGGQNVEKNYTEAIKWYSQAADKGKLEAMDILGYIYDFGGYGVERNIKKVLLWRKKEFEEHLKRANNGNVESQRKIGVSYEYGHGVEKNIKEAIKWYERASSKGDGIAKECLERITTSNKDFETTKTL